MVIEMFGLSANPFTVAHLGMATTLAKTADKVIIVPSGIRPDKDSTNVISPVHRAVSIELSLQTLPREVRNKIEVDYFDLDREQFTPNHLLQQRYGQLGDVRHVVGFDLIEGGADKKSYIHLNWQRPDYVWNELYWTIFARGGYEFDTADLPPRHSVRRISGKEMEVSSKRVRSLAYDRKPLDGLVVPAVAEYIKRHRLYQGLPPSSLTQLVLDKPRIKLLPNPHNIHALAAEETLAEKLGNLIDSSNPNLLVVLGGDGTLIRAAREHWHERIPILGLHFGTVGHNLNDIFDKITPEMFREPLEVWTCPLLNVQAEKTNGEKVETLAFNDAWVCGDSTKGRGVRMKVSRNGLDLISYAAGDGFLVSTPQGSTGYALSMGASPLRAGSQDLLLVGNNLTVPRRWKQANLSISDSIRITNADIIGDRKLYGCADDQAFGEIHALNVRASRHASVELVFFPGHGPLSKLDRIQFPQ